MSAQRSTLGLHVAAKLSGVDSASGSSAIVVKFVARRGIGNQLSDLRR